MRTLRISSVCKDLLDHAYLAAVLLVLFLRADVYRIIVALIALSYCFLRTRDRTVIGLLLCFLIVSVPRGRTSQPEITEGRVVSVSERSAVVYSKGWMVQLYCEEIPILDSVIAFEAGFRPVEDNYGFYRPNTRRKYAMQGIHYYGSAGQWSTIKESRSLRGWIQRRAVRHRDRPLLYRILLGMRTEDLSLVSYLMDSGLSWAGLLMALDRLLKYWLDKDRRSLAVCAISAVLCLIYRFPFVLLHSTVYRMLKRTALSRQKRLGASTLICLTLMPYAVFSASFWIPFVYRSASMFSEHPKAASWYAGMIVHSLFFHAVNPLSAWLYPVMSTFYGILFLVAAVSLFVPFVSADALYRTADHILAFLNAFRLPGSLLGAGLPFYVLSAILVYRKKKQILRPAFLFLLFMIGGLFHPFAELSFINVGQGDAILIREPFNRNNILVDTGKPSQYHQVDTFLLSKGIRCVDTLFITHNDSDHNGNQERIEEDYHIPKTVTQHFSSLKCGELLFYDLNHIDGENDNQNSLVQFFRLNGMSVLLMGDADAVVEERLVREYGQLRADILKAGHHGSATASSQIFLQSVQPRLAVLSCGSYRIYHHPSREVIERLKANRIPYLDTKRQGDITILCLPGCNLLLTSAGRFAFFPASV